MLLEDCPVAAYFLSFDMSFSVLVGMLCHGAWFFRDTSQQTESALPLLLAGFGYMWSGARANVGMLYGRYYFKVKIHEPLPTTPVPASGFETAEDVSTVCGARVGLSHATTAVGHLGDEVSSWG